MFTPFTFIPPNPLTTTRPSGRPTTLCPLPLPPVMCAQTRNGHPPPSVERSLFRIRKTVMPADTDYSFALWHGSYIRYLEEARVRYLLHINVPYETVVRDYETELIVHELSVKYMSPARLGDEIAVTVDMPPSNSALRIPIESKFINLANGSVLATAVVTLVAIDVNTGRPRRKLPEALSAAFRKMADQRVESG